MVLTNPWEPERGDNESQKKLQEQALRLFNTCQCSWCKLFYTQPFLCVPGTLHSNCSFFKELSEKERKEAQEEKRNWSWSWRASDMILRVQDHGVLKKCRICGSLNPNPDKYICWKCGKDSLIRYDIYNYSSDFDVVGEKQSQPATESVAPTNNSPNKESTLKSETACKTCVKNSSSACPYENQPAITRDGILSHGDLCDAYSGSADSVNKVEPTIKTEKPAVDKILEICPNPRCGKRSLVLNEAGDKYSCTNLECPDYGVPILKVSIDKYYQQIAADKKTTTNESSIKNIKQGTVGKSPNEIKKRYNGNDTNKNKTAAIAKPPMPKWLIALLLIFTLSFIGLVINVLIGSFIPFWILFGFSIILSLEKWFSYDTRKHKLLGKLYRLILNLAILSLIGLVIWSGVRLFSHQFVHSAIVGSILFIGELAFFIWAWTVVTKNSWRWPSMKLTIFSLICLFVVFSFAGVQPLAGYKNTALNKIKTTLSSANNGQTVTTYSNNLTTTIVSTNAIITPSQKITTTQTIATGINPRTGVYNNYYLGLVTDSSGEILGGDGCYDDTGDFIVLINNKNAINPTYAQLINFLQSDTTDEYPYIATNKVLSSYYGTAESHVDLTRIQNIINGTVQPNPPDVCGDFAERLHNDAEMDGIRCAYVSVDLSIGPHALDAFQTTDRGLVYIDDTGISSSSIGPSRCVKTVDVAVGQSYIPISLFPEADWDSTWDSMGTVIDMQVTWDGTWNN